MQVPGILKNKYVGYAVYALAILNILGYLGMKSYECLALFGLTAYSANCYCKNRVCAILAGLFVANFIFGCGRLREGLAPMSEKLENLANCADAKSKEECGEGCNWDGAACAVQEAAEAVAASEDSAPPGNPLTGGN